MEIEKEITVFRVQDKTGRGPFYPGFTLKWNEGREDMRNLEPHHSAFPDFNVSKDVAENEHCGSACSTLKQLQRWFIQIEFERLQAFGFKAVSLNVDRIICENDTQLIFARTQDFRKGASEINLYV